MEAKPKKSILKKKELLGIKDGVPVYQDKFQLVNERVIGRNESCPCNSGKKFKKCCLTD